MALSTISGTTGITDATITSAKLADFTAAVDLNGVELILDADQDNVPDPSVVKANPLVPSAFGNAYVTEAVKLPTVNPD